MIHLVKAYVHMLFGLHVVHEGEETIVGFVGTSDMVGECGVIGRVEQCRSYILISAFISLSLILDVDHCIGVVDMHDFSRATPA